jgi:hypothetical protein
MTPMSAVPTQIGAIQAHPDRVQNTYNLAVYRTVDAGRCAHDPGLAPI